MTTLTAEKKTRVVDSGAEYSSARAGDARALSGERRVFLVLAFGLWVVVFGNQWGNFNPDTTPELYANPWMVARTSLESWRNSPFFGGVPNFNTGLAPLAVIVGIMRSLGLGPGFAVRVWRYSLMVLGAWGVLRLFRHLAPDAQNRLGRAAAAVVYVANPFFVVGGINTPVLLPGMVLPWFVLAFMKACEQRRGWRGPALAALAFAAMSGVQAGIIPMFLSLSVPCVLIYLRLTLGVPWRSLLWSTLKWGIITFLLSLYWLVPSFAAGSTGAAVASETEDPEVIALTTSWSETIRGMGEWPQYGRAGVRRLFRPNTIDYVVNPLIVAGTFAYPLAAALGAWYSRHRARLLSGLLLAVAIPVYVGMFPPDDPTPMGRLWKLFLQLPGGIAFRTTHKVGALIILGYTISVALGAARLEETLRRRGVRLRRAIAAVTAVVFVAGWWPPLTGKLFREGWFIPDYWYEAADVVNGGSPRHRALFIPGSNGGNYIWGVRSPDELLPSLLDRNVVARKTVTGGMVFPANFLAVIDVTLRRQAAPPGLVSALARYLGADTVVLRNDLRWWENMGPRPSWSTAQLAADPGLEQIRTFGSRGQFTSAPASTLDGLSDREDRNQYPLVQYKVSEAPPVVQLRPTAGTVVIEGDGMALPPLVAEGVLDGFRPFRFAGDLEKADLSTLVEDRSPLVLTDTNRRRIASVHRVDAAWTSTLQASDPVVRSSSTVLTLFPFETDKQSVTEVRGLRRVRASRYGPRFGIAPYGDPMDAFDGELETGWIASDFGLGAGEWIRADLKGKRPLRSVTIYPLVTGRLRIASVLVEAGSFTTMVPLSPNGTRVELPGEAVDSVKVTITELAGEGSNPVGLAEVILEGVEVEQAVRMPTHLSRLLRSAPDGLRGELEELPLHVLFTRAPGSPRNLMENEELRLVRHFELPFDRRFTPRGTLGSGTSVGDDVVDALADGACIELGRIDDEPIRVRMTNVGAVRTGRPTQFEGCDELNLAAGDHRLQTHHGWIVDTLLLEDAEAPLSSKPNGRKAPAVHDISESATDISLTTDPGEGPFWLITGKGYDPRWEARVDGRPQPRPVVVNGFSVGWRISSPDRHRIDVVFTPQRAMDLAVLVSAVSAVATVIVLVRPRLRK